MRDRPPATIAHPALQRVRRLSYLLDNAIPIPGTRWRFGLDPLLGLLPGGGDMAGAILSAYIVFEAARFGLPRSTLVRMLANLVLDSALGSLPVMGDVFDATWKSNSRNLALLEAHAQSPEPRRGVDRGFIILLIVTLVLILVGLATIVTLLGSWFVSLWR